MITSIVGWLCTITLVSSYAFKGNWLRIVNSIASILFIVYGILLKQLPMIVSNGICLMIHLFYIFNLNKLFEEKNNYGRCKKL